MGPINCSICCLCQVETCEGLECPAATLRKDAGAGYNTLADHLQSFSALGGIPNNLDIESLAQDGDIEKALSTNKASWHKSCRAKYNKTKIEQAQKRKFTSAKNDGNPPKLSRKVGDQSASSACLFCDRIVDKDDKYGRFVATLDIDAKVRQCAEDLQDTKLLAKLAVGDMPAIDAKYHSNCLTSFYKRHEKLSKPEEKDTTNNGVHGIVFAELIAYIEEGRGTTPSYKLADLAKLYNSRLGELDIARDVHTT